MPPQTIIFDFDGTLADTMKAMGRAFLRLADDFGLNKFREEDFELFREKKPEQVMLDLGITRFKLPLVVRRWRRELGQEIEQIRPFPGVPAALIALKERGHRLGILTTNSRENVKRFLRRHDLDFFDFIHCGSSLFAKGPALKSLLKREGLRPEEVVYVGDETRDVQAARQAGTRALAVTWGFNTRALLQEEGPDWLIEGPEQLLEVLGG